MTTETTLVHEDFGILFEALDAWVDKDAVGNMIGSLLPALLPLPEDKKAALEQEQERRSAKAADEKQQRKEVAVLIQAKLVGLRDRELATAGGTP